MDRIYDAVNPVPPPFPAEAVFTTRCGGVSRDPYAALNLGDQVGDSPQAVAANRLVLARAFPGRRLIYMQQVHGCEVRYVSARPDQADPGRCDGIITDDPAVALVVLTADCLPLLLASADGAWVAAVHCGWRGVARGIIPRALAALTAHGGRQPCAFLGAGIGRASFEVGAEVQEALAGDDPQLSGFFEPRPGGRLLCDLRGICHHQLRAHGVSGIVDVDEDTCACPQYFYSYRRDGPTGRQACAIGKKITPQL